VVNLVSSKKFLFIVVFCVSAIASSAQMFTTLASFNKTNGDSPAASLVQGTDGSFYGITAAGGQPNNCPPIGCGTVFNITRGGTLTTLYTFCSQTNCTDGSYPAAALVQATDGNFYGTTSYGADGNCMVQCGTVFKITPSGNLTTLYSFCANINCPDGDTPSALVQATDGNFYGTTFYRGPSHGGTVFRITPIGTLTTLYSFCANTNCTDGYGPSALIQATDGNFYGTTASGGTSFDGTVFRITPGGTLTTLYNFCAQSGCTDGAAPRGPLLQATDGNLYGITQSGGTNHNCVNTCGTVFRITLGGAFTTLHSFDGADGNDPFGYPAGGLMQATDGNFYGATEGGANKNCYLGCGSVFKITPGGALTALHKFDYTDGAHPFGGLVQGTDGNFYGTTSQGGATKYGTVFSLDVGLGVSLFANLVGNGTIASSDGYINCGTVCSASYKNGIASTLTATPAQGWVFSGWSGCDTTQGNTCTVTMNSARNVTATCPQRDRYIYRCVHAVGNCGLRRNDYQ